MSLFGISFARPSSADAALQHEWFVGTPSAGGGLTSRGSAILRDSCSSGGRQWMTGVFGP